MESVLWRARSEEGFGLIELLMAMTILNVGILALVAAFQSGAFALKRASATSTAAAIADIQLEKFRAITYSAIALDATAFGTVDTTYTGDVAYSSGELTQTCATPLPDYCKPVRSLTGPDGKLYRVDTYVINDTVTASRTFKRVTVVVRDANALSGRPLTRIASTFDVATGS